MPATDGRRNCNRLSRQPEEASTSLPFPSRIFELGLHHSFFYLLQSLSCCILRPIICSRYGETIPFPLYRLPPHLAHSVPTYPKPAGSISTPRTFYIPSSFPCPSAPFLCLPSHQPPIPADRTWVRSLINHGTGCVCKASGRSRQLADSWANQRSSVGLAEPSRAELSQDSIPG
ncbi:unnamed protein product [Protopolystoma xenopodis]|uniref:Uncharacterized protein n=1 Tax=Protopolystoma xenopodis TaxID=117903 RepID=A0A3S5B1U2_9PLAT|nr:unnamed protein product [Protopolystoma xenopodis]